MADVTSVYIRHNLETNGFDNFKADIEKRLNISIDVICYAAHNDYLEVLPDYNFKGWVLDRYENNPEDYDCSLIHYDGSDHFPTLWFSKYCIGLTSYCVDYLFEWWSIPHWLDNIKTENVQKYNEERRKIFEIATLFGADSCIMYNGEQHENLNEYLNQGYLLQEAIQICELENKQKNKNDKRHYNYTEKLYLLSAHELEPNTKYLDSENWYNTILVDDFRDFKK